MIKPTDEMSQNKTGNTRILSHGTMRQVLCLHCKATVRILPRPPGSLFRSLHNFPFYSDWSKNKQTAKQIDVRPFLKLCFPPARRGRAGHILEISWAAAQGWETSAIFSILSLFPQGNMKNPNFKAVCNMLLRVSAKSLGPS